MDSPFSIPRQGSRKGQLRVGSGSYGLAFHIDQLPLHPVSRAVLGNRVRRVASFTRSPVESGHDRLTPLVAFLRRKARPTRASRTWMKERPNHTSPVSRNARVGRTSDAPSSRHGRVRTVGVLLARILNDLRQPGPTGLHGDTAIELATVLPGIPTLVSSRWNGDTTFCRGDRRDSADRGAEHAPVGVACVVLPPSRLYQLAGLAVPLAGAPTTHQPTG